MRSLQNFILLAFIFSATPLLAQPKVMNPGEAIGQLIFLSAEDVQGNSEKFKSLTPLSLPVFSELPMELSVVAGTITLAQQNLLSHVQIKSRARRTPNLDISQVQAGWSDPQFNSFREGDWIQMLLEENGGIVLKPSTEQAALEFYEKKQLPPVSLIADLKTTKIFTSEELGWKDFDKVGSKAANYAELAKALNTPERIVVNPGFAIPFYYYQQFVTTNPAVQTAIQRVLRDPLMNMVAKTSYREKKLNDLQTLIYSEASVIDENLLNDLIGLFDQVRTDENVPRRMKLRSSTNAEDLKNFNGAGLYSSESYKPEKKGKELSLEEKRASLKEALKAVWASIWNLRAFEERAYFRIPHEQVVMGVQVNPSFKNEDVDGVVISKNVAGLESLSGKGVYIEAQRGDTHSVANPSVGTRPEKILVLINPNEPLNQDAYKVHILQKSNIADDKETILTTDNPNPIMSEAEIKDLAYQVMKAELHFKPLLGADSPNFSLDLEFKVDPNPTGTRAIYLKQARPYID